MGMKGATKQQQLIGKNLRKDPQLVLFVTSPLKPLKLSKL